MIDPVVQMLYSMVRCGDQGCSLVTNTRSRTSVVPRKVLKLGVKVKPHLEAYRVPWSTNTKLKVDKWCPVTFSIGKPK